MSILKELDKQKTSTVITAQKSAQKEIKEKPAEWVQAICMARPARADKIKIRRQIVDVWVELCPANEDTQMMIAAKCLISERFPKLSDTDPIYTTALEKRMACEKIWRCIRNPKEKYKESGRFRPAFLCADEIEENLTTEEINNILQAIYRTEAYFGELFGLDDIVENGDFDKFIEHMANPENAESDFLALSCLESMQLALIIKHLAKDIHTHFELMKLPGYAALKNSIPKHTQESLSSGKLPKNSGKTYKKELAKQNLKGIRIVEEIPPEEVEKFAETLDSK